MPFANPRGALQKFEHVPVTCSTCGIKKELQSPSNTIRNALIDASFIRDFQQELALLKRTQALFDRFPKSSHPIKVSHEHISGIKSVLLQAKGVVLRDTGFIQALNEDEELKQFLTNGSFFLPGRLKFVSDAYINWQKQLDDSQIKCEYCDNGHYVIEESFFKQLV